MQQHRPEELAAIGGFSLHVGLLPHLERMGKRSWYPLTPLYRCGCPPLLDVVPHQLEVVLRSKRHELALTHTLLLVHLAIHLLVHEEDLLAL